MNKIAVYTAIFNDYDWLKDPVIETSGIDFICYTDSNKMSSKKWKVIKLDLGDMSPSLMNRKIKLLYPYTELSQYDYTLYVDGSILIKGDILKFLSKYIEKEPLLMNFKHPNNNCIFKEINNCIEQGRGNAIKLDLQGKLYKQDGMPEKYGLSDNKIILRKNCGLGKSLMNEWFYHVQEYSGRDQVCLSYVLWKNGLNYNFFDENIEQNEYFETWPHRTDPYFQILWRKIKWFCERTGFGSNTVRFLNNKVKPLILKHGK